MVKEKNMKHKWNFEITNKEHVKEHGIITVQDYTPGQEGRTAQFYFGAPDLEGREIGDINEAMNELYDSFDYWRIVVS